MSGRATVLRANARSLPLADDSVDLVVTSPPYFALRSYQDGGEHYAGQIGDEPTPAEFVASLLEVTRECVRVLKPSSSLWVNLGDKYSATSSPGPQSQKSTMTGGRHKGVDDVLPRRISPGAPPKSLIGIPWRYALACIDDLGLILRAEVIWSKPNGLPESVTDRVRRSHEQWFYFEQSRGDVVEPGAQGLPLCSLCGRPADSRASLVARLHELDSRVEHGDLSDKVGTDQRVQRESGLSPEEPGVVGLGGSSVPLAVPRDSDLVENPAHLLDDGQVSVVDKDAEVRASGAAVTESDAPFAVDDSSEPSDVCRCSHPLIVNDEPWIPQQLAADLMQMVADGEADAQAVSDFLSGDYARTHSTWFHFTLEPRYFSAVDEIREPYTYGPAHMQDRSHPSFSQRRDQDPLTADWQGNPLGKLPGSVWTVPTEPLRVPDHLGIDHFAAFPTEWPKRIISGWSPAGVCVECDSPREDVWEDVGLSTYAALKDAGRLTHGNEWVTNGSEPGNTAQTKNERGTSVTYVAKEKRNVGTRCACSEPTADTRPAVVLDPFGGTGTTAMVAKALGRHGISVDMSADYCRLAEWRTNDPAQLAKARGLPKPEPISPDQLDFMAAL